MKNEDLVFICNKCPACKVCQYYELCEAYYRQFNYYPCELKYLDFYSTEMYSDTEIIII